MAQRMISLLVDSSGQQKEMEFDHELEIIDRWEQSVGDNKKWTNLLVHVEDVQQFLDAAQPLLDDEKIIRITVSSVEASLPLTKKEKEDADVDEQKPWFFSKISREELYNEILHGVTINANYLLQVFFSTLVGAVALIDDNVPMLIGAMVIAPLLGPQIALGFAAVLGDLVLVRRALRTAAIGMGIVLLTSLVIGLFIALPDDGVLMGLTKIGYESVVVAFCSGAVGVISLAQPARSNLVGVMVAVALLPPAVATGLFIGNGDLMQAGRTGLLLLVNIACIVLAAQLSFTALRIRPHMHGWLEKKNAEKTYYRYLTITVGLLGLGVLLIAWIQHS